MTRRAPVISKWYRRPVTGPATVRDVAPTYSNNGSAGVPAGAPDERDSGVIECAWGPAWRLPQQLIRASLLFRRAIVVVRTPRSSAAAPRTWIRSRAPAEWLLPRGRA